MSRSGCDGSVQARAKTHRPSASGASFPARPPRSVPARNPTPQKIKEELQGWQLEAICRDWLPEGKRQGSWWVSRCPWRQDKNPSLGVSLTTGNWRDFATSDRGDIFDLSMKLFGDSFSETIDAFADMLGMKRGS